MIKRQFLTISCAVLLGAAMMTGCGNKNAATENETTEAVVTEAVTETATEAPTEIPTEAATETATEAPAETTTEAVKADGPLCDTTVAGWHFVVEDMLMEASLENVSVELGYTGVETSNFVKEASAGNNFCLVKLLIEKEKSTEVVDWSALKLTDKDGNEYTRIEDEFLIDLGMMRMPGTSLNFGSNEGWIAFEVKEGASGLTLSYPFKGETFTCALS